MTKIPFNKPFLSGDETTYIVQAVNSGKISGNGDFTKRCQLFFETNYQFKKCLLTTSCTDALEMAAILINIKPGDEVLIPSFTFVSTANPFIMRGAKIVFVDSEANTPNIDANCIEKYINSRTKAVVVVHYAGIACDMDAILAVARKFNLFVVEDAAQAIDSYYKNLPLGGLGNLGAFSFHETKNIISGEGGMIVINDPEFSNRAEIIWEKGTNRSSFNRGEVDKYGWIDIGSSFLPSEIISAFLFAQLENLKRIQQKRLDIWNRYFLELQHLQEKERIKLPFIPDYATNNSHIFYVLCRDINEREKLILYLKSQNVQAVFHYQSLHRSPYFSQKHDGSVLKNSDYYSDTLLRLPLYYDLSIVEQYKVISLVNEFFSKNLN